VPSTAASPGRERDALAEERESRAAEHLQLDPPPSRAAAGPWASRTSPVLKGLWHPGRGVLGLHERRQHASSLPGLQVPAVFARPAGRCRR
jgi:hypothetical protein